MRKLVLGLLLFFFALVCYGQNPTAQTINSGATLPTGCTPSNTNVFILISGGVGTPYYCSAINTWTIWTGGGGSGCTSMGAANTVQKADGAGGCAASSITDTSSSTLIGTTNVSAYRMTLQIASLGQNPLAILDQAGSQIATLVNNGTWNASGYAIGSTWLMAGAQMQLANSNSIGWSGTGAYSGTKDVGLGRDALGVVGVTDGILGTNYRDMKMRNLILTGSCTGCATGTVTSIATTAPITGGTITTTGTIACATCVTSSASLTSTAIMTGAGLQASQTPSSAATVDSSGNENVTSLTTGAGGGATGQVKITGGTSSATSIVTVDATNTATTVKLPNDATAGLYLPTVTSAAPSSGCAQFNGTSSELTSTGVACGSGGGGTSVSIGTFASLPACTSTAFLYLPTDSLYTNIYCDGASTLHYFADGKSWTRPSVTFTNWSNQGSSTLTETFGYSTILSPSGASLLSARYETITALASFDHTFLFRPATVPDGSVTRYSPVWLSDGTKCMLFTLYSSANNSVQASIATYTNTGCTTGGSNPVADTGVASLGSWMYVRVIQDATNLTIDYSADGNNWNQHYQASKTTFFGTGATQLGYGAFGVSTNQLTNLVGFN